MVVPEGASTARAVVIALSDAMLAVRLKNDSFSSLLPSARGLVLCLLRDLPGEL